MTKTLEQLHQEYEFNRKEFLRAVHNPRHDQKTIDKWYDMYCLSSTAYHQAQRRELGIGASTEVRR